jgi:hypothetical protein
MWYFGNNCLSGIGIDGCDGSIVNLVRTALFWLKSDVSDQLSIGQGATSGDQDKGSLVNRGQQWVNSWHM